MAGSPSRREHRDGRPRPRRARASADPAGSGVLGEDIACPPVRDRVLRGELAERVRPTDPAAELGRDDVELVVHAMRESRVARDLREVAVGVLPLEPCALDVRRHELRPSRRRECVRAAARRRPGLHDLFEDPLAERVARTSERERDMSVQALEMPRERDPPMPKSSEAPSSEPRWPPASSRRSRRCSSVARSSDAASVASSATARLHRSTPPAASSRATAATR